MSRLFIIGNGYDVARRKDTFYSCFKRWLINNYVADNKFWENGDIVFSELTNVSSYSTCIYQNIISDDDPKKMTICKENELNRKHFTVAVLLSVIDKIDNCEWKHFEEDLSKIPFREIIDNYKAYNTANSVSQNSVFGAPISRPAYLFTSIPDVIVGLFAEWIHSLKKADIHKCGFENRIIHKVSDDDIFLIFNYTKTIEELFPNAKAIYHIHGIIDDVGSIVVGHNDKDLFVQTNLETEEDYIKEAYSALYKNPEAVINKQNELWDRLANATSLDIYEFGWSCSDVDKDYIEKIVNVTKGKPVHLYLNNHDNGAEKKKSQWEKYEFLANNITFYEEKDDEISFLDCRYE